MAKVLHTQISGGWGEVIQGGPVLGVPGDGPVPRDQVLGPVAVVHVEQQADDVQDVHVEEHHHHHEIRPGADAAPLDVEPGGAEDGGQRLVLVPVVPLLHVRPFLVLHVNRTGLNIELQLVGNVDRDVYFNSPSRPPGASGAHLGELWSVSVAKYLDVPAAVTQRTKAALKNKAGALTCVVFGK